MKLKLTDIAEVIRSKNSGPYELTFDIIFRNWDVFEKVCSSKAINSQLISRLYSIPEEKIINIVEFKPAKAIKFTIVRPMASGELGETDVYGAQQHAPLLDLVVDI
ncbi:MAG TPA: DUF4387 domain-containing protein [Clostridiaceae bacterium]|nr:DUF4387 domain-containing protein [Clostridiaceae bacterium]